MKTIHQLIVRLLLFCLLPIGVVAEQVSSQSYDSPMPVLYNEATQDRMIMLGFKDSGINRIRPPGQYRMRGGYQSTAWARRMAARIADDYGLTELTAWPITEVGIHCIVYKLPDSMSIQQALQKMAKDTRLDLVQSMQFYRTRAHQRYTDPYYKLQPQVQSMHIEELHEHATGKNITIALIDTGVDYKHPDLKGQVSEKHNYAVQISPNFFNDLHGTAVAGVMVAHAGNGAGIVGIAPDSKILALKSCWPTKPGDIEAVCNSFTLALAINQAIESNVDVLNLSLSGRYDPLLDKLIRKAIKKGIVVVAASEDTKGNNFPASLNKVLGIYSQKPVSDPDNPSNIITAPGDEILTTFPKASYDFISGSSFSAAHISAIVALLLEHNPDLKPGEIATILTNTRMSDLHLLFN